jgi:hypothetical protein
MRRLVSFIVLVLVLGSVVAPFTEAGNSKKFEKLRDVQVRA